MKNFAINLSTGKLQHCTEMLEKLGKEVRAQHKDAVASDHEGPDTNLKDAIVYVGNDGRRCVELPPHYGGRRCERGMVYRVHKPFTVFVDTVEGFYHAQHHGGKTTLVATDAVPGKYSGATGEVVEINGCPVFKIEEDGAVITHLLSTIAVKKLRRKVEETLRHGRYSQTMRVADVLGVSLIYP